MYDYSKGKIYLLRCKLDTTAVFVGYTITNLDKIKSKFEFRKDINEDKIRKYLDTIYSPYDKEDFYIELYKYHPCNSKQELGIEARKIANVIGNLNSLIYNGGKLGFFI